MKERENQIEEMAKDIENIIKPNLAIGNFNQYVAVELIKQGWVRPNKDSVVLSREEINNADYFYVKDGELIPVEKGRGKFITNEWYKELLMKMPLGHELAKERKETAEKFLQLAYDRCLEKSFIKKVEELAKSLGVEIKED